MKPPSPREQPNGTKRKIGASPKAEAVESRQPFDRLRSPGGPAAPDTRLWYRTPARSWNEALPIGNGRLGAMVFGGIVAERLQLNESSLVSGYPGYRNLPLNAGEDYAAITEAIASGQYAEATRLVEECWLGACWACYQPLGDLDITFEHRGRARGYRRELDIASAICRVGYEVDGVHFTREIFASHPDEAIILRLKADQRKKLSFRLRLGSPHPVDVDAGGAELRMRGQAPGFVLRRTLEWVEQRGDTWKYPELWDTEGRRLPNAGQVIYNGRGMFFDARLTVQATGGKVRTEKGALSVKAADEVLIILTACTSYNGFDKDPAREGVNPGKKAAIPLKKASTRGFSGLLNRHIRDYTALFNRVKIDLGPASNLPTDRRLIRPDPSLAALYFQFARYLLIAGSRENGQPLNLQGIWNEEIIPPWSGQYTLNINAQMNYWPAEVGNLPECAEPLLRMIRELAVDGHRVARQMYGRRGWVAHHNTTLWREAQPVDNTAVAAYWPMGAGWLCLDLFEHYRFCPDREFLREAYPLMKDAALFFLDWLVPNADGRLVTPVSTSPENTFYYGTDRSATKTYQKQDSPRIGSVSAGSTMDMSIIRELFQNTGTAASILGLDPSFRRTLKRALAKLLPFKIGARGQLQEWQEDLLETELDHRHVSHLFALHPAAQVTRRGTPELAAAAARSLDLRGDGGTGWSKAWKIAFRARLGDGDHAHKMVMELLAGSTLPNLLDTCPPFQIDGNFGGGAGIVEMLLQSQNGEIELLPALPAAWPAGSVSGLRARGGYEVGIRWRGASLEEAVIKAGLDGKCRVRLGDLTRTLPVKAGKRYRLDAELLM